jgi:NAD(P)-dependent dehydrogenase (short-subunit alcohol dehydrogenase family)
MRDIAAHDGQPAKALAQLACDEGLQLTPVELDVTSDTSVERAVELVLSQAGGIDVPVHNAGHMTFGPAEAFMPEQLMQVYDVNMDALAQSYALELARFGIESTILLPGAFTKGTEYLNHAGQPGDPLRAEA